MPIFEYACAKCEDVLERIQPGDAALTLECPVCGSECPRIPSVTVVGHVGLKKVAEGIDARMKLNEKRGKKSSSDR